MPSVSERAKKLMYLSLCAYDPTATTNDDSCMYTGGLDPVGGNSSEVIKPFEDACIDIPTNGCSTLPQAGFGKIFQRVVQEELQQIPIPSAGQGDGADS